MGRRRQRSLSRSIVALSASYQRDSLLERGMGLEHLKELVVRIARPLVCVGLSLAYAGGWRKTDDNFTYLLLRLISAEQDDTSDDAGRNPDAARNIEPLINHVAWPHYREITPRIEAEWINSCRILRIRQEDAGLEPCPDAELSSDSSRALFNAAVTLSVMRRKQTYGMLLDTVPGEKVEDIPGVAARILLGGKTLRFSGFAPGVFEEALLTLEASTPLYVLGGFGGAAGDLADLFVGATVPKVFDAAWLESQAKELAQLNAACADKQLPDGVRSTDNLLGALKQKALAARNGDIGKALNTGLSDPDTRLLMTTSDMDLAVRLVRRGLEARGLFATASP